jgi:DNA-binding LacI/PurR family transcriptional regulator
VTAYPTENGWQIEEFFRALYAGARARAEQHGYVLSPFWLYREGVSNRRFSEILWARGIRGILFNPLPSYGTELDLAWEKFSVIAHGLSLASPIFHRTTNDHHQSMTLALTECRRRGYLRPGCVLDEPTTIRLEYRWEAAYAVLCAKLGFRACPAPLLLPSRWLPDEICRWAKREKIDVVIGLFLEEQINELAARGIGRGADIGLLSLSVADPGSPLSGICQNPAIMGAAAVDQLITLVERNETGVPAEPVTFTIKGHWNEGRTVRRVAASPLQPARSRSRVIG